jgi:hypothetical protein
MTGDGTSRNKYITRSFTATTTTMTRSAFLRRGTYDFVQFFSFGDATIFANFNLLTGQLGSKSTNVESSITPWRDGWYRCTMTTPSSTATTIGITLVSSRTAPRTQSNTLATFIYIAGPQLEEGAFATSYIPTTTAAETRARDFASIEESNFTPWYNPVQGTFGVEF